MALTHKMYSVLGFSAVTCRHTHTHGVSLGRRGGRQGGRGGGKGRGEEVGGRGRRGRGGELRGKSCVCVDRDRCGAKGGQRRSKAGETDQ